MNFDQKNSQLENNFIRNSPSMLNGIFGTAEVTPFWVADMDFVVADPIRSELQRLVDRGQFAYEFDSDRVFNAISRWYQRRHNVELQPSNFVQVPGVLTGIALLIRELSNEGDGVVIQTPAYHQFSKVISTAGREVIKTSLHNHAGHYEMDFIDLDKKLSLPNTKVMILCNPHNPVGRVWRKEELERVIEIADKRGVTIISDEIHADITYAGSKFTSLVALAPERHVAMLGSPAKTFGMQSISNGYIYTANPVIFKTMKDLSESLYIDHGNALTTFATIAAYEKGDEWVDALLAYLTRSVDWIQTFVAEYLPNVTLSPVEGTYQVWLDFSEMGFASDELVMLLGNAGFGASPGSWFGEESQLFARVNIASPLAELEAAFMRLATVLNSAKPSSERCTASSGKSCC